MFEQNKMMGLIILAAPYFLWALRTGLNLWRQALLGIWKKELQPG
jgi:hypothetical protein